MTRISIEGFAHHYAGFRPLRTHWSDDTRGDCSVASHWRVGEMEGVIYAADIMAFTFHGEGFAIKLAIAGESDFADIHAHKTIWQT